MKTPSAPQSATSLPVAPRDDAGARFTKYIVMMAIRLACVLAMVLITPYSWYTWLLGLGAVFLPYIAVVVANVGSDVRGAQAERPDRMLTDGRPGPVVTDPSPTSTAPAVFRISESRSEQDRAT